MGLPVYHPSTLKSPDVQAELVAMDADVIVVAAYGLILRNLFLWPALYRCVNIHASLLPRWRGATPINRAIMAGDTETGITIMHMDAGLDTGPMLLSHPLRLRRQQQRDLHDCLASLVRL